METEICNVAPPEWVRRSVEDVCLRVTSGGTPSRRNRAFYEGGVWPWVTSRELQDQWVYATEECITDEALASSSAKILPPNTILMALYGATAGQLGLLQREMTCNQACCAMVVDPTKADFRYLFYQLIHARPLLKRLATGAAQQNLSGQLVRSLRLPFAPLSEQRTIAHILGSLDDKIELNRRMSKTLESIAQAIFKSWFIDFDPVKAKMDGREPYGLKREIADLFPSRLVESELGPIPEGWRVGRLGDLVTSVVERTRPSSATEAMPYVPIECISSRTICLSEVQPGSNAKSSLVLFRQGDILFGAMRPYFHKVCVAPFHGTTRTTVLVLRPKASELGFAAFAVSQDAIIEYATANSVGSTIPYVKWADTLDVCPVVMPPSELRRVFSLLIEPLLHRMMCSVAESRVLSDLRDTLLPKLISGEIRVPDAERFLEVNT